MMKTVLCHGVHKWWVSAHIKTHGSESHSQGK